MERYSMETLCGALAYALGVEPPKHAAQANPNLVSYIDEALKGGKVDRLVLRSHLGTKAQGPRRTVRIVLPDGTRKAREV